MAKVSHGLAAAADYFFHNKKVTIRNRQKRKCMATLFPRVASDSIADIFGNIFSVFPSPRRMLPALAVQNRCAGSGRRRPLDTRSCCALCARFNADRCGMPPAQASTRSRDRSQNNQLSDDGPVFLNLCSWQAPAHLAVQL